MWYLYFSTDLWWGRKCKSVWLYAYDKLFSSGKDLRKHK